MDQANEQRRLSGVYDSNVSKLQAELALADKAEKVLEANLAAARDLNQKLVAETERLAALIEGRDATIKNLERKLSAVKVLVGTSWVEGGNTVRCDDVREALWNN